MRSRANGSLLTNVASTNQQLAVSMRGLVRNSKTPGQNCPNQPSFTEFKLNSPAAKRVIVLCSQGNVLCRSDLGSNSHPSPTERTTENINPQSTKLSLFSKRHSAHCMGLAEGAAVCLSNHLLSFPHSMRGSSYYEINSFMTIYR